MNGDELGCSDLHLAVQDTLLVGQVIEDFQSADSTKMHRLQVRSHLSQWKTHSLTIKQVFVIFVCTCSYGTS